MRCPRYLLGAFLMVLGCILVSNIFFHYFTFSSDKVWPLYLLIPGLLFEIYFFKTSRDAWILIPGGVLTTLGVIFLIQVMTRWNYAGYTWPMYLFPSIVGLTQYYIFSGKSKALLIPVYVLSLIAAVSILVSASLAVSPTLSMALVAVVLIVGGFLMMRGRKSILAND